MFNPLLEVFTSHLIFRLSSGELVVSKVLQVQNAPTDSIVLDHPVRVQLIDNQKTFFGTLNPFSFAEQVTVFKNHIVWVDIPDQTIIKHYNEYLSKLSKEQSEIESSTKH